MTSVFGILHTGASGMRAGTLGVSVSSQNATNATTAGYSRRSVRQEPLETLNGVRTRGPSRAVDPWLERRYLGAAGAHADASSRLAALQPLDAALSDDSGLGAALDAFETSLRALSASPSDRPTREAVLSAATSLSSAFQRTSRALTAAREDADSRIADDVARASTLATDIDRIQTAMKKAEITGEEASDLRDQRDQKIRELGELVPVTTVDGPRGTVSVLLDGGVSLVSADGGATPLRTSRDTATGMLKVVRTSSGLETDVTSSMTSGSVGGLLRARDVDLAGATDALDQLAFDLGTAYDAAHAAGVGLDGGTGRQLFSFGATVAGAAAAFSVSTDVLGQPDRLGAATDPALASGDNRNALVLMGLASVDLAGGGTRTASEALADLVSRAGESVSGAASEEELLGAARDQTAALRESVSGVSSDDEMVAMMQYQRAYEASLKVIQTADQMLEELIGMKR